MKIDLAKYEGLKFECPSPGVLEIVLDRPSRLNALDQRQHRELSQIWTAVDADPDISVALLRGEGGNLSAGGDLDTVDKAMEDWDARMTVWKEARDMVYNIINCSKPIVAAIEGVAVGAGLAAALVSDVVVAGRTARIIDGHTRLGVVAGDHSAIVWPILCGMAKAKYYLLLCERMTGEEAERLGLVSMCVDDDAVLATARETCERLVKMPPAAVRLTKYALNNWLRMAGPIFDTSLALEVLSFTGPEVREGVASLREKRPPMFDRRAPV